MKTAAGKGAQGADQSDSVADSIKAGMFLSYCLSSGGYRDTYLRNTFRAYHAGTVLTVLSTLHNSGMVRAVELSATEEA